MSKRVACLGSGSGSPGDVAYDQMTEVGRECARRGVEVYTGAYGGTGMEAPARGANEIGGTSVGFFCGSLFPALQSNSFLTKVIDCHTHTMLGGVNWYSTLGIRLTGLLSANGFIVAAGGGIGTFFELVALILHNAKVWNKSPKPIVVLHPSGAWPIKGWELKAFQQLKLWGLIDDTGLSQIYVYNDPINAVRRVLGEELDGLPGSLAELDPSEFG
ncbi:MAG: hypothetical protein V1895_01055 [Parcubacteria group bacterium]